MLEDLYQLRDRAKAALNRGSLDEAVFALISAAHQTHVADQDYVSVLRPLSTALEKKGDARSALTVEWYLATADRGNWNQAVSLLERVPKVDAARTLYAMGDVASAAREMENAGLIAAAAVYRERSRDLRGARALWSRLSQVTAQGASAYNAALIQFNLSRCAKACNDPRQAREASIAAIRLLEEAADHFESIGQRERAFDCFQVLTQIGKDMGFFEDVLEGYINCIRILREDHLKYFALQYFDEALVSAKERGEYSASAMLAREIAEYCRALGMPQTSAYYTVAQAELWREVAAQHQMRGAPPEIAENALLAAVLAFGEMGQFTKVGKLYEQLANLELEDGRRSHYARASLRYNGVRDEALDAAALPSHLKHDSGASEVWHVDVLEWEQQGSAAEACADVLLDKKWPDLIRRKAMLARLTAFATESRPDDSSEPTVGARARLAGELAQLQLYCILSPLEALYARPERAVKLAVLGAMQTLFFKRTFVTVRAGLRERDAGLVEQASKAVESLYFQHAFDPLSRIVRESTDPGPRASALRALARIDTHEAAEFLLGMLDHGAPADKAATIEGLSRSRAMRFVELARAQIRTASPPLRDAIGNIFRARGIAA